MKQKIRRLLEKLDGILYFIETMEIVEIVLTTYLLLELLITLAGWLEW